MDDRHQSQDADQQNLSPAGEPSAEGPSKYDEESLEKPSFLDLLTLSGPGDGPWPKRERTALAIAIVIAVTWVITTFY